MVCFNLARVFEETQGRNSVKNKSMIANNVPTKFEAMKVLRGPNSKKKYAATVVLLSIIVTTFIVTRNKRAFVNDYAPNEANIGKQ